jgi:glycosyltransferase involved in cell wall biosynthesis
MLVTHFQRQSVPGSFYSIERIFRELRRALSGQFQIDVVRCPTPYHSRMWLLHGLVRARARRADVNHVTGDIHYVALGLPGGRTILTVHDLNRLDEMHGVRKHLYSLLYFTLPLRRCRFVTTISSATRDRLVERFPVVAGKVRIIPDCVPEGFAPLPRMVNSRPRVLQIGTKPNKNLETVARALQGLSCTLHVVGPLSREQRSLLKGLNIQFENSIDLPDGAMIRAYERADVLAFVSLSEGFGMPIIEAQSIGRPVITSDITPMNETAGDGACLVDPYSSDDIRAGILRIVTDETYRDALIQRGFQNVPRFSRHAMVAKYSALYEEVLSRNQGEHANTPSRPIARRRNLR